MTLQVRVFLKNKVNELIYLKTTFKKKSTVCSAKTAWDNDEDDGDNQAKRG